MTGATAFRRAATSGEFNQIQRQDFLSLYPNRAQGILRAPGCKTWTTVSKHFPINDSTILRAVAGEETSFWGLRWGDQTQFAVFDIDPGSKYQNALELNRLNNALAEIGLKTTVYQSSTRLGWHVYLFFDQMENSNEVQQTLKAWLTANDYEIRNGVLEVYPSGMGLRLPLQEGFAWLDQSGEILRRREELSTSQAISRFLTDLRSRASNWTNSRRLIESQLEAIDRTKQKSAQAHAKATDTEGFEGLFNYRLIPEKYQDGRQYWKSGLLANGQRHDAIMAVEHYLWHGDIEADIPALAGQSNDRLRYELIRVWIEQKHNGYCNHIKRGNWRKVEAQIKRAVVWRRPNGATVREDYALTERAIERLIGLYKSTGRLWTPEDFRKGNEGRRETAREKIRAAFELLTTQGRRVTLRQLMRLTGCHHHTINRNADIWSISSPAKLPSVAGDLNPFLDLDPLGVGATRGDISCVEDFSVSLHPGSSGVVSLFGRHANSFESSKVVAYTSNNPSSGLAMADEVEKKIEQPQPPRSLEEIVRASQFTDKSKLETWSEATADYRTTQKDSATMEALSDEKIAEIKANGGFQKFELFESTAPKSRETFIDPHPSFVEGLKAVGDNEEARGRFSIEYMERKAQEALGVTQKPTEEQILLASNITPSTPNFEQLQHYQDIQSDSEKPKIAQQFEFDSRPPTLLPDFIIKAGLDFWDSTEKPFDGIEDRLMATTTAVNPHAWEDAAKSFPQLSGETPALMRAYTRNELAFYGREDWAQDMAAASGKSLGSNPTLGMAQITAKGVQEFEQKYPQLKAFLASKGYSGTGHEMQALLDPECVPMIVATKTASIVDDLNKHGIKHPSNEQLAYGFNPDVYSYSDGHGGREYKSLYLAEVKVSNAFHWDQRKEYYANKPDVIKNSRQVHNVHSWLK